MTRDQKLVAAVAADWRSAPISARESALCAYADKLTTNPREMSEADLRTLRSEGLDDGDILDLAQVVAYFNYVNRIADGLGVQLEKEDGSEEDSE
ncbi:MAG: peroxidase [Gemmatimonadetes bacterium]|nr:peroxidase [Gemmatimonadota bacterium]